LTVPYTHKQNGHAERLNRTLVEKGRAMLLDSKFNKNPLGEAVCAVVYLINRSPTSALEGKTPAEMRLIKNQMRQILEFSVQ